VPYTQSIFIKTISEALDHSSVAFTMDVSSHIIESRQEDARMLLDGIMPESKIIGFRKKRHR
jgi:hypothetical protein